VLVNPKIVGMLVAAFVAGSFIASPELRAYAANTVFSGDIVDGEVKTADLGSNSVTAGKIKDGEVKAAEIATDAVGAAEIQGVTKLLFGQCAVDSGEAASSVDQTKFLNIDCAISGVDADDSAVATKSDGNSCFEVEKALPSIDRVIVVMRNDCSSPQTIGTAGKIGIVVFDK
jgi:hypothetical protein